MRFALVNPDELFPNRIFLEGERQEKSGILYIYLFI